MAKFQLAEGEKLIGSTTMAFVEKAAVGDKSAGLLPYVHVRHRFDGRKAFGYRRLF